MQTLGSNNRKLETKQTFWLYDLFIKFRFVLVVCEEFLKASTCGCVSDMSGWHGDRRWTRCSCLQWRLLSDSSSVCCKMSKQMLNFLNGRHVSPPAGDAFILLCSGVCVEASTVSSQRFGAYRSGSRGPAVQLVFTLATSPHAFMPGLEWEAAKWVGGEELQSLLSCQDHFHH